MRKLKLTLTLLTIVLGARTATAWQKPQKPEPPPPPAVIVAPEPTSRADKLSLRQLVELTGIVEKELRSIDVVMDMFKRQSPNVPDSVWVEVRKEFDRSFNRESIITMYAAIYATHFNPAEVRKLIAFYASPVGRKLVTAGPLMEMEAMLQGVKRGMDIGERIRELLKSKGYNAPAT